MGEGKSHRSYEGLISQVQVLYRNVDGQRCSAGAFEHDGGPFGRTKQNVCPQERALKCGITPGPTYVAGGKAGWGTLGRLGGVELGVVDEEDENVGEEDVWKTRDGDKGIAI